jgi:hypothetical protein|tara:strand:+ start:1315 stop:1758 length:444 start_codon:yes stop_codon:yes gene_type:complete
MTHLFIALVSFAVSFSKADFYSVMSGDNENSISNYISKLENAASNEQKAYKGALLMKKASFQKTPKEKLVLFKEGRLLLENEISKDSKNTEYRFLRLIIQENAPKILKYNTNISEDAALVKKYYPSLNGDVKKAVESYSKSSTNLKL